MKRKSISILSIILIIAIFAVSCGKPTSTDNNKTSTTAVSVSTTTSVEPTENPEPDPKPEPDPMPDPEPAPEPGEPEMPIPLDISERQAWNGEINRYVIGPVEAAYFPEGEEAFKAFKNIIDGIFAHKTHVNLTDSWDDNLSIWGAAVGSPYYFVVDQADISKDHKGLDITYKYDEKETAEMLQFIDDSYTEILRECITEDMSDLEKVLSIYHYFAQNISYDYDWYNELMAADFETRFNTPDIAVYDALKTGYGVCHSYTFLCQFAFQQLGIECLRVHADTINEDSAHMWPVVVIDGIHYNIDPTWDSNGGGIVGLKYFGMNDYDATIGRGLSDYHFLLDQAYGDFVCEDTRFYSLHDVTNYYMNYDGTITAFREDGTWEVINIRDWP